MHKIKKNVIIGVLEKATHMAAKIFETGKMVSDSQFHDILENCHNYEHLYFWIESLTIKFGKESSGKPSVEIICKTDGIEFRCGFSILEPHYKFSDHRPFAQRFYAEEIVNE